MSSFRRHPKAGLGDMEHAAYSGQIDMPPIEEKELRTTSQGASSLKAKSRLCKSRAVYLLWWSGREVYTE